MVAPPGVLHPSISHFDRYLVVVVDLLIVGSLLIVVFPRLEFAVISPTLEVLVNTTAILAAAAVAILAWIRFEEGGQPAMLYQAGAFAALAVTGAAILGIGIAGYAAAFGSALEHPNQVPIYAWSVTRVTGAVVLVAGAMAALGDQRVLPGQARGVLVLPSVIALALLGIVWLAGPSLPVLIRTEGLTRLAATPAVSDQLPGITLPGALLQTIIGGLFLWGAALYRRLLARGGPTSFAYLSIGLVVAAFSQLHFALYPGAYASLVTAGDLLRVAFYGLLLLGVEADARAGMRELRKANRDLERLRDAEVSGAALQERTRLAREVHDGLAQDLWFAKLKAARLAEWPDLAAEPRELAADLLGAIDSGLADTRQALMALRAGDDDSSFADLLGRYVEDFADRFGIRVDFVADGELRPLSSRVEAELLRIAQEALNNVRKHADATLVRVRAGFERDCLRLSIADNGRGFDPDMRVSGYGLQGMRERAGLIGGTLEIATRPGDGTEVALEIPFEPNLQP